MAPAQPLLRTEDVAALLQVHPKHVYRLLKKGLPARRVGAEWRFDRDDVMRWSARGSPGQAGSSVSPEGGARQEPERPAAIVATSSPPPPLVAGNGDLVVAVLLRQLQETGVLVGLVQADQEAGLRHLEAGRVVASGSHAGGFPTHAGGERLARIHLVAREVGLA